MSDRRKADRRMPPAVAQHAIEERAELLARIEELEAHCVRLGQGDAERYWEGRWRDADAELAALKLQPIGVVLPEPFEMRSFQTVDRGCTNYKAGFNAAIRKARESLNSLPVSAGVTLPDDFVCGSKPLQDLLNATAMLLETPSHDSATYWAAQLANVESLLKTVSAGVVDERDLEPDDLLIFKVIRDSRPSHSAQSVVSNISRQSSVLAYRLITKELETLANGSAIDRFRSAQNEFEIAIAVAPAPGKQEGE